MVTCRSGPPALDGALLPRHLMTVWKHAGELSPDKGSLLAPAPHWMALVCCGPWQVGFCLRACVSVSVSGTKGGRAGAGRDVSR